HGLGGPVLVDGADLELLEVAAVGVSAARLARGLLGLDGMGLAHGLCGFSLRGSGARRAGPWQSRRRRCRPSWPVRGAVRELYYAPRRSCDATQTAGEATSGHAKPGFGSQGVQRGGPGAGGAGAGSQPPEAPQGVAGAPLTAARKSGEALPPQDSRSASPIAATAPRPATRAPRAKTALIAGGVPPRASLQSPGGAAGGREIGSVSRSSRTAPSPTGTRAVRRTFAGSIRLVGRFTASTSIARPPPLGCVTVAAAR